MILTIKLTVKVDDTCLVIHAMKQKEVYSKDSLPFDHYKIQYFRENPLLWK